MSDYDYRWSVGEPDAALHVLPRGDIREHAVTEDCWCEPRIEGQWVPFLVIHHSADQRELFESQK